MSETARLYAVTAEAELPEPTEASAALLTFDELDYVTETATGLLFREDTPIEVVGTLIDRLTRQQKRIEWCIGDALNFAERRYGDTYTAWVEQTGLSENTLSTYRWVADRIPSLRRREDVGWSHHREVAALEPAAQDRLLERAAEKGMTRFELRQAVKTEQERVRGRAATAGGDPIDEPELAWHPGLEDLTAETRQAVMSAAPTGRHRMTWIAGAIWALVWNGAEDAFTEWRGP
jgi:hypothetical protein